MIFTNRESTYPGRVKITKNNGSYEYVTIERADIPINTGTELTATNLNEITVKAENITGIISTNNLPDDMVGEQGPQGIQGPKGDKGDSGTGVSLVQSVSQPVWEYTISVSTCSCMFLPLSVDLTMSWTGGNNGSIVFNSAKQPIYLSYRSATLFFTYYDNANSAFQCQRIENVGSIKFSTRYSGGAAFLLIQP